MRCSYHPFKNLRIVVEEGCLSMMGILMNADMLQQKAHETKKCRGIVDDALRKLHTPRRVRSDHGEITPVDWREKLSPLGVYT
jgi:hypothetical protein